MPQTHYVPHFCESLREVDIKRSVCGTWVRYPVEHSAEPDCQQCLEWIFADAMPPDDVREEAERRFGA